MLDWIVEPRDLECAACRRSTASTLIARRSDIGLDVVACGTCGSLAIVGAGGDAPTSEEGIDAYVEYGAGVDALLANTFRVGEVDIHSVLDIGCGYGFAIAYASFHRGWDTLGVDPSTEARRGVLELGLDIRPDVLQPDTDLGRTFDLVIASEALEHVRDPLGLLQVARAHLSDGGRLVLTTPDAACVTPRNARAASQAVAGGSHFTLYSAAALRTMLTDAGFGSFVVDQTSDSLVAVAAVAKGITLSTSPRGPSADDLDAFYADLIARTQPSSSLGLGVRARRYTSLVAQGRWEPAAIAETEALESLVARYGADLSRPTEVSANVGSGTILTVAHAAALSRLAQGGDSAEVLALFDVCERAVAHLESDLLGLDAGSQALFESVRRNRTIALARADPERAPKAARDLISDLGPEAAGEWVARTFCELALGGATEVAARLALDAQLGLAHLPDDAHGVRIAMNTARGLAVIALKRRERWTALGWIGFEEDLIAERGPKLFEASELGRRRSDLAALRGEVVALEGSVVTSVSPSISPSDESLLWSTSRRPAARKSKGKAKVRAKVSVVISLYNGLPYIEQAIRSVLAQTLAADELIVVDDGSTDGAAELVATIASPIPIHLIRRANGGQSSARNAGIRAARGEFIAFLDQDDEWRPEHLRVLHRELASDKELAWVFSDFDAVDGDGQTIQRHFVADAQVTHPRNSVAAMISADIMALPSASLLRREALVSVLGFDRRLVGYEDDDLFVRLFRRGWTYRHVPVSTIRYRMHVGGASSTDLFLRSRLLFLETLLRAIPDDHRLGLYLSAEFILPRFFAATIHDYTREVAFREFDRAKVVLRALEHIALLDPAKMSWQRRLGLRLMRNPSRYRRLISFVDWLPAHLRPRISRGLFLSATSQVRADRRAKRSSSIAPERANGSG